MMPMAQHILPVLHAHPLKKAFGPASFMSVPKVWEAKEAKEVKEVKEVK